MSERQVTIGSKVGLHARPASLFAKAVKDAGVPVQIAKDGQATGERGEPAEPVDAGRRVRRRA